MSRIESLVFRQIKKFRWERIFRKIIIKDLKKINDDKRDFVLCGEKNRGILLGVGFFLGGGEGRGFLFQLKRAVLFECFERNFPSAFCRYWILYIVTVITFMPTLLTIFKVYLTKRVKKNEKKMKNLPFNLNVWIFFFPVRAPLIQEAGSCSMFRCT